jgi:sialate O-acetylesterase
MALSLPKTGMALAIDIGNPKNIHPRNKQEVGRRLALQARVVAYGEKLVCSGPEIEQAEPNGTELVVRFKNCGGGLEVRGEKLEGFEIAGQDRKYHPAEARIARGSEARRVVLVSSPAVPEPLHVRYAWADNPKCTLYNKEGLPAAPFRTDDWPGVTVDKR